MSTIDYARVEINFIAKRGATFRKKIKFSTKSGNTVTADNITGSTWTMKVSRYPDGGEVALTLSAGSGLGFDGTDKLVVTISAAQSAALNGIYYYDIKRTYPDNTVAIMPEGTITFKPNVTNA